MNRIYITGNLSPEHEGLIFDNVGQAINFLQDHGYNDNDISLVRFIPVN